MSAVRLLAHYAVQNLVDACNSLDSCAGFALDNFSCCGEAANDHTIGTLQELAEDGPLCVHIQPYNYQYVRSGMRMLLQAFVLQRLGTSSMPSRVPLLVSHMIRSGHANVSAAVA